MTGGYWLGVDLGGTKILSGLFDDNLKLLARSKHPTDPSGGPAGVMARVGQGVEAVLSEAGVSPGDVRGMGFGVPGQIVVGTTKVRFAPNLDWKDVDLGPLLPAGWRWPLVVENDVRMGTYGEYAAGAAKGARTVFGVFVGTGVGGGLVLDGRPFAGFNGNAGEVGNLVVHWRKGTILEDLAGRKGMMSRAAGVLDDAPKRVRKEWKGVDPKGVRSHQLSEFYQKGDPVAVQLVDDAARALGAAVGGVVNLLSPEVIVVGGGVAQALGDAFIERLWEIAQRYTLPGAADGVKCVPVALGDDSGIVGCAAYAKARQSGQAAEVA
ncbi:MAG: ROK family protein [Gemmataceae bacterium]|nr:ROK family protein [Gemmataceae bacterium]